jgi:hypothetical protein
MKQSTLGFGELESPQPVAEAQFETDPAWNTLEHGAVRMEFDAATFLLGRPSRESVKGNQDVTGHNSSGRPISCRTASYSFPCLRYR